MKSENYKQEAKETKKASRVAAAKMPRHPVIERLC
jgi:hypothetical protein